MKLEPELIKAILVWCEENLPDNIRSYMASQLNLGKFSTDQIVFHVKLLSENGYLDYIDASAGRNSDYILENLTLNGYQYLNLLKSKAWNAAKGLMHEAGAIFAEAAIKAVIDKYNPIS